MLDLKTLSLKTEEQKKIYEQELIKIKAKIDAELNYSGARQLRVLNMQKTFIYTFLITIVGACAAFLLKVLS